jgi:NAD(P)-dependent dehydrogenase (short-subunit alcohol dehydrogenase family)
LDLVTKLFYPGHPVRHVLNAVIALHECHNASYKQMAAVPLRWSLAPVAVGWIFRFVLALGITVPWLCWQLLIYAAGTPFRSRENLAGKTVLITGVSRGLGMDIMLDCLEQGARVLGIARSEEARSELRSRVPAAAPIKLLLADLSKPGALTATLEEAHVPPSSIDIAILCAGVKHAGKSALCLSELRDTLQVNLLSIAEFSGWFIGRLPRVPATEMTSALTGADEPHPSNECPPAGGPITPRATERTDRARLTRSRTLAVVSSMGRWHGMHFSGGYNASKAALSIWAESLEMELTAAARPLRVTIVEPGLFDSGMTHRKGAAQLLFAPRRSVARRIVSAALSGNRSIRPPFWFAWLTWATCLAGRGLRYRLFARFNR